ncbi:MAG: FGGY-family carbohydrate kinase, partial [Bacteroidia bacterium]|nr:FGGY-family carbohydrate kinase [Bacteroidia bacterium]
GQACIQAMHVVHDQSVSSTAYQSAEAIRIFEGISALHVDGGVSVNNYLMQLQADLIGCPVLRPIHGEVTAWGVASLAAAQVGISCTPLPIQAEFIPKTDKTFSLQRWREAVRRAQGWAKQRI